MLHIPDILILLLTAAMTKSQNATEETGLGAILSLGSTLQNMVLQTVNLCGYEIFTGRSNTSNSEIHTTLCRFLLEPHPTMSPAGRSYSAGHYGYDGFNPLTLLAGLAFLAFLLQTLHALLYRQTGIGVVRPMAASRKIEELSTELGDLVGSAVEKYELLNSQRSIEENYHWLWTSITNFIQYLLSPVKNETKGELCDKDPLCHYVLNHRQEQ